MTLKEILIAGKLTVSEGGGGGGTGVSAWMDAPEPTDNKLHIWINVDVEDQKPIKLQLSGTGDVEWGDGSTDSSVSLNAVHTYADFGVYEIVIGGSITIPDNNLLVTCSSPNGANVQKRLIRRVYIPSTIAKLGNYKLQSSVLLEKATVNSPVIGEYAFEMCRGLRDITVGDGVTTINKLAFSRCENVDKVTVGAGVTTINRYAFEIINALEWHFKPTTPPTLEAATVFDNTKSTAVFYVPAASVDAYKAANFWSNYASRIQAEP